MRMMPEVTVNYSALGRSWKETFNTATKEEAEAAMQKQGTTFRWFPNGDCRTITVVLSAIRKDPRMGKHVFFNSVIAAFTVWNDARNRGDETLVFGDGTPGGETGRVQVAERKRVPHRQTRW